MARSTSTTLIPHYCVRDTLQVKFAVSCRRWKQIKRRTIFSRLTMEMIPTIATFTSCADDLIYLSGLPP